MREESWYVFGFKTDTPEELVAEKISGKWEDRNHMSWEEREENPSEVEKKALKEVAKFAEKHEIPFSMDLMNSFVSDFNKYQPQWNSSSAYC